jgi:tripartite-type tricarboxylate transporter receptor subunit TctC
VERLHDETVRVLQMPEVVARLEKLGATTVGMGQREFADLVREEIGTMGALIRQAGIRVE